MTDTALYRKYRPATFDDVVGQAHVVSVLNESITGKNIGHAYLFFGSRGTGKTSVARILAREIGCADEDLYEMDAASNRGIDDVRELRDAVHTLPFSSPYKVYIIDEVHMLTKEAFNALLKTLEEPPAHVVFILATTEVEKVPDTVVSRCQTFTFKRPTQKTLEDVVTSIAKKEGYTIEPPAAEVVALIGDGSFRDTLVTLQKVLGSVSGNNVTQADVAKVTAAPSGALVNDILLGLAEGSTERALGAIATAVEHNVDMVIFLKLIVQKMRAVMLLRFAPNIKKEIEQDYSPDDMALLAELATAKGAAINSQTLLRLLDAYHATTRAHIPQLPLELALIDSIEKK